MKNLFRAATGWLNKTKSEESPQVEETAVKPVVVRPVAVDTPVPVKRERRVEPEPEPAKPAPVSLTSLNAGPEVKIFTRASKTYATCPHCEASWNLRERMSHPSFRRDESKGLTCPACDKGVSLPGSLDLRKLS